MNRLTTRATGVETSAVNQMGHNYIQVDDLDEAIEKLSCYEDTGLEPGEIEELVEKNRKQKMSKPNPNAYCCPECGEVLNPMWDYCPWCGQRVED